MRIVALFLQRLDTHGLKPFPINCHYVKSVANLFRYLPYDKSVPTAQKTPSFRDDVICTQLIVVHC